MYKKFRIVAIPLCAIGVACYGLLPGLIILKPEGNSSNKGIRGQESPDLQQILQEFLKQSQEPQGQSPKKDHDLAKVLEVATWSMNFIPSKTYTVCLVIGRVRLLDSPL